SDDGGLRVEADGFARDRLAGECLQAGRVGAGGQEEGGQKCGRDGQGRPQKQIIPAAGGLAGYAKPPAAGLPVGHGVWLRARVRKYSSITSRYRAGRSLVSSI